jgi:hypothetical protein
MALQALQNQRRIEQRVQVSFDDRRRDAGVAVRTPRAPDEIAPPAPIEVPRQRATPDLPD